MRTITIIALLLCSIAVQAQQKQPDTSRAPKIYWRELIQLQQINAEISRRINLKDVSEKISGYRLKGLDTLTSYAGSYLPMIYNRVYPADTLKKKEGKK